MIGDDEGMECDGLWDGEAWNIAEVEVVGIVGVGEVGNDLERVLDRRRDVQGCQERLEVAEWLSR